MKRPSSLFLLPLALALGYGAGQLGQRVPEPAEPASHPDAPEQQSLYRQKRELWRSRFLKLLEEPSFSRQSASYYALAKELPVPDMPSFLEGMYPEGWTRFRGDLPLALFMEWAKRDSAGLAQFTEQLFSQYPDLHDNLNGVYYNLGLQNAPGAIAALDAVADGSARRVLAKQFIDGLESAHPEALFPARLRLLGPEAAFSRLTPGELEQATAEFWAHSGRYAEQNIAPNTLLAVELGRRYQEQGIQILSASQQVGPAIAGSIVATGAASPQTIQRLNTTWFNWRDIENVLSDPEKRTLLAFLSSQEDYWKENRSRIGPSTLDVALDRQLADRLVSLPGLPEETRNDILSRAARFYSRPEYLQLLGRFDGSAVRSGLSTLIDTGTAAESLGLLEEMPAAWRTAELVGKALQKALRDGSPSTFDALCERYPEQDRFLPHDPLAASALWHHDPERYLSRIESLDDSRKERQLQMIASTAADEELAMILESGTFDQQTDVLIGLLHDKPFLSTEILKHEDPRNIDPQQATQIGVALAYAAEPQTALSYFEASDLSQTSSQIALLNYCLGEALTGDGDPAAPKIAQLSPQHDYLYRTAAAFRQETENPESLLSLRQEAPDTFVNALTSLIGESRHDSLRRRAKRLLSSPALSGPEKLKIHNALYGAAPR